MRLREFKLRKIILGGKDAFSSHNHGAASLPHAHAHAVCSMHDLGRGTDCICHEFLAVISVHIGGSPISFQNLFSLKWVRISGSQRIWLMY